MDRTELIITTATDLTIASEGDYLLIEKDFKKMVALVKGLVDSLDKDASGSGAK